VPVRPWRSPQAVSRLAAFGQSKRTQSNRRHVSHDPEKHVLDAIGDGHRFSDKIMRKQIGV
jgi:hypothetical protein